MDLLPYEDEIRSVEGPDAPASVAGGVLSDPIPVEVGGGYQYRKAWRGAAVPAISPQVKVRFSF
jgi:hypothetical protein